VYPRTRSLIVAGAIALAAVTVATACGGGGSVSSGPPQVVPGPGFRFSAPGKWHVRRQGQEVSAAPKPIAPELVSVSKFPLLKPYTPALFGKATGELDRSAADLASRLGGSLEKSSTGTVVGQRVRQYLLVYPQGKDDPKSSFSARLTYVLRGRTEYELFCRWDGTGPEPDYCTRFEKSFRPV
jgi:hypothetical protein